MTDFPPKIKSRQSHMFSKLHQVRAFQPPAPLSGETFTTAPLCCQKRLVRRNATQSAVPRAVLTPGSRILVDDAPDSSSAKLEPTTRDSNWMFYDVARVLVCGGRGGNGIVAFRREKGVPRGGPAGGSGGRGGSVVFKASRCGNTLSRFRGGAAFRAQAGSNGLGKGRHGVCASDLVINVPLGTVIRADDGRALADLQTEGAIFYAARGGRGGRGNSSFKTEQNRAPRICEQGESGVERWLRLELKLVADVGLVGFPNAGKSALLDAVSNARPKIADYPFTTIVPNLGVVDGINGADGLVIADVPGLIGGAHRGVGMGLAFLRHIERCKLVVHVIDGTSPNVVDRYRDIRQEMELFSTRLARKKEVVLVNKSDLAGVSDAWVSKWRQELVDAAGHRRIALVSAKTQECLPEVMRKLRALVESTVIEDDDIVILGDEDSVNENQAAVKVVSAGVFRIEGSKVKTAFDMTNWDYVESIDRFQRILEALGVNRMLIKAGAQDGDSVICYDRDFNYYRSENIYSAAAALDGYTD